MDKTKIEIIIEAFPEFLLIGHQKYPCQGLQYRFQWKMFEKVLVELNDLGIKVTEQNPEEVPCCRL